jgi:hypothetical protein
VGSEPGLSVRGGIEAGAAITRFIACLEWFQEPRCYFAFMSSKARKGTTLMNGRYQGEQ